MLKPHRAALAASLALTLFATPALAGPPWIAVEYPVNPHDRATRGALALIHTYHHGDPRDFPLSGTAEGLVDGRRRSAPLEIVATSRPGVYAVRGAVPAQGTWILALHLKDGSGEGQASALVALGPGREVTSVRVPYALRDGWMVPHAATAGEVEDMLRLTGALAQAQRAHGLSASQEPAEATLAGLGLLLLPVGVLAWRRRR